MQKRRKGSIDEIPDEEKSDEVVLLTEIRDLLRERSRLTSTYRSNAGLRHCTTSAGGTSNIFW